MIVATTLTGTISNVMLCTGNETLIRRGILSLKTLYRSFSKSCSDIRILTWSLNDTSPSWVSTHIHHRRKSPMDSIGGSFPRHIVITFPDQFRIKRCCHSKWNRQYRIVSMNHVKPEYHRYVIRTVLHSAFLQFIVFVNICIMIIIVPRGGTSG